MNYRVVFALFIVNKAGSLIYQRDFSEGLQKLSTNEYIILAGTFHRCVPRAPPHSTPPPPSPSPTNLLAACTP